MRLLIFACILFAAECAPQQGYTLQRPGSTDESIATLPLSDDSGPSGLFLSVDSDEDTSIPAGILSVQPSQPPVSSNNLQQDVTIPTSQISAVTQGPSGSPTPCVEGQVLHIDGRCVTPEISRNVYVYNAPEIKPGVNIPPEDIPPPRLEHNIVFIRLGNLMGANDPIVIPPPQRRHTFYVLNKNSGSQAQRVIHVPTPAPRKPEVYFVNYGDGHVPTLPDGTDLKTTLQSAVPSQGIVLGGHRDNSVFVDSSVTTSGFGSFEDISIEDFENSFEFSGEDGIILAGANGFNAVSNNNIGSAVPSIQGVSSAVNTFQGNTFQRPPVSTPIGQSSPQNIYSTP